MAYAVLVVVIYLVLFLGGISPIHCRVTISFVGLICIGLSVLAGFGTSIKLGYDMSLAHEAIPVLMLGIGVDDMFIICNAFD